MRKDAITITVLAGRLERAIHCDVGMRGLEILLHGWIRKGAISRETLRTREKRDGEAWLSPYEVQVFSMYAGYDLTQT